MDKDNYDHTYLVEQTSPSAKAVYKYPMDVIDGFIFNGFDYVLPEMAKNIINRLAEKVGSPDYIKTPIFKKRKDFGQQQPDDGNDWASIRSFNKTVVVDEERSANELVISEMKKQLNKLTNDNYDIIRDKMFEILYNHDVNDSCMREINEVIFAISSGNAFFANVYARFMKDMIVKYESMRDVFEGHLAGVMGRFDNVRWCNPEENYDEFCKINTENGERRALVGFFVQLCIIDMVQADKIVDIFYRLYDVVEKERTTKTSMNKIEEVVTTIFGLVSGSMSFIKKHSKYADIVEKVNTIANINKKTNPGLSNKAIFKMLDLVDIIEAN
uniref:MIF4G domain-containing protein n=1 Tax=viral metagenome TaxID=1070528 RepID=A0A6C0BVU0_9ZZZZ